ncbi:hypothetical protein STPH2_5249 [Streptomyces sp. KO7888]|nr:hypothetical protein [Streptomyces sp. KO7888]
MDSVIHRHAHLINAYGPFCPSGENSIKTCCCQLACEFFRGHTAQCLDMLRNESIEFVGDTPLFRQFRKRNLRIFKILWRDGLIARDGSRRNRLNHNLPGFTLEKVIQIPKVNFPNRPIAEKSSRPHEPLFPLARNSDRALPGHDVTHDESIGAHFKVLEFTEFTSQARISVENSVPK